MILFDEDDLLAYKVGLMADPAERAAFEHALKFDPLVKYLFDRDSGAPDRKAEEPFRQHAERLLQQMFVTPPMAVGPRPSDVPRRMDKLRRSWLTAAGVAVAILVAFLYIRLHHTGQKLPDTKSQREVASANQILEHDFEITSKAKRSIKGAQGVVRDDEEYRNKGKVRTPRRFGWFVGADSKGVQVFGKNTRLETIDGLIKFDVKAAFDRNPSYELFFLVLGDDDIPELTNPAEVARWLSEEDRAELQRLAKERVDLAASADLDDPQRMASEEALDRAIRERICDALRITGWTGGVDDVFLFGCVHHVH